MDVRSRTSKSDRTPQSGVKNVTRVISFTGGKGGVGKTHTVVNTALALTQLGKSVLLLDADLGLANVDILLGIRPRFTLHELFCGERTLEEIIVHSPDGIDIIPAASGVESICTLSADQRIMLTSEVERIAARYEYLLIDTQAGIGLEVMYFNSAASEIVCIVTPDPTSLTDSYALIKVLSQNYAEKSISVIVNNVSGPRGAEREARATFDRLRAAVDRFLHVELKYLGFIPTDSSVQEAIRSQQPLLVSFPSSAAGLAITNIARKLDADFLQYRIKGGMQFFFRSLLELTEHGS